MLSGFYDQWHRLESWYWWYVARAAIIESILERLPPPHADDRLLNVACGTGMTSERFGRFGRVVSLDYSSDALRYCGSRGLGRLVQAEAQRLPFRDKSFRRVAACDILEHLREDRSLLDECRRVLEPGGYAVITVPALDLFWTGSDDIQHERRYSRTGLERRIRRAGFQLERLTYFNSFLLPLFPLLRAREWLVTGRITHETFVPAVPQRTNELLRRIFTAERAFLRHADLPIGVSLLAVARRPS